MKIDKYFESFQETNIQLPRGITLDSNDQKRMRLLIYNYLNKIYNINNREPIFFNNLILNPEYLSKAINNRTLLKKLVYDERGEILTNIKSKYDLFAYVENNLRNLFHPDGIHFNAVYNLLSASSLKGSKIEDESFKAFIRVAAAKGIDVIIEPPTIEEDKSGIDGKFSVDGKVYTIQIKPLSKIEDYRLDNTMFIVFCDGVLKDLITDYLIVTKSNESRIFRSKGIIAKGSYFLIPKSNEVLPN